MDYTLRMFDDLLTTLRRMNTCEHLVARYTHPTSCQLCATHIEKLRIFALHLSVSYHQNAKLDDWEAVVE